MKNIKYFGLLVLLVLAPFAVLKAQFMPVVFDKLQSSMTTYNQLVLDADGQLRLLGVDGNGTQYLRLTPKGLLDHSKTLSDFVAMNVAKAKDGSMLAVGGKENGSSKARFIIINTEDNITLDYQHSSNGYFDKVLSLRNGGYILGGYEFSKEGGKKAIAVVLSSAGKVLYTVEGTAEEACAGFVESVEGALTIAFSSSADNARVVRYAPNGKLVYSIPVSGSYQISCVEQTRSGEVVLAGGTQEGEARVVKVRPEGAIVFDKVFGQGSSNFTNLVLSSKDEILLGGSANSNRGQLLLLRNDGTILYTVQLDGPVSAIAFSPKGDVFAAAHNETIGLGQLLKITSTGTVLFDRPATAKYDYITISVDGETTLVSTSAGRVTQFKEDGTLLSDRPVDKTENPGYLVSAVAENGDIVLAGKNGRITKLGHGLMVNDITVQEPLNGFSMANFTVTLTGFQRQQGIPSPVSVQYKVMEGKATKDDIILSSGFLSFVPTDDGSGGFMVTQTIEVPIKADNLLEGNEEFYVRLEQPESSYLIKSEGKGTIVDQPAIVRFISSEPGREPSTAISYTIGLFKTDGTPVTNVSGSDVIVTGIFGQGTASEEDYRIEDKPYFAIAQGASQATHKVGVISDDKYEIPESVILRLNQTDAMSDLVVELEGGLVNCVGYIYDQPAYLAISSLGDKGKNSNTVQGFFRTTLVRASDDKPLVNCTGSNILITSEVDASSTAVKGEDFVLINESELTLPGDCQKTTVNVSGIVLNNTAKVGNASVVLRLTGVTAPENAGALSIHPRKGQASFNIIDTRR